MKMENFLFVTAVRNSMYAIDTEKWNFSSSNASIVTKMKKEKKEDEEGWWNENLFVKCDMMRMIPLNCKKKSWDFILSIEAA
jgi:hypothetical protein